MVVLGGHRANPVPEAGHGAPGSCADGRVRFGGGLERWGSWDRVVEGFGLEGRLGAGSGGEADDDEAEEHDGDDVDAAFGAVDAAGEEGLPVGWVWKRRPAEMLPLSGTP